MHTTIASPADWKFFLSFRGAPFFVGAPARPNMLNMPKSASEKAIEWKQTDGYDIADCSTVNMVFRNYDSIRDAILTCAQKSA